MANIYLGPSGSETLLPVLTSLNGSVPSTSVALIKNIQMATMSDGSRRFSIFGTKRRWSYSWGLLTYAELSSLQTLYALNQELRLQNNYESTTWYTVIFLSFVFEELRGMSTDSDKYFAASITIEEI